VSDENKVLYEACVGFMVGEKTTTDSWAAVAQWVHENRNKNTDDLKGALKDVEARIKEDFKVTALPSAWRSAKSTALDALRVSVALVDEKGEVVPKTELSRRVKNMKGSVPRNDEDTLFGLLDKANTIATGLTKMHAATLITCRTLANNVAHTLKGMAHA
jgi:hypothetical protein